MDKPVAILVALAFVFGAIVGVATSDDEETAEPAAGAEAGQDAASPSEEGEGDVVVVEMTDANEFVPAEVHVEVGDTVRWVNTGRVPHTVTPNDDRDEWPEGVEGSGDDPDEWLAADQAWEHTFETEGTFGYHCIPHAFETDEGTYEGMTGVVVVHEEGQAPDQAEQADGEGYPETKPVTIDELSRHPSDLPADTEWARYEDGTYTGEVDRSGDEPVTHEVHFQIEEGVAEMVEGTTMEVWTFDGKIPGPMLRVQEGDHVDFTLHNPEDSHLPHDVDFHAVTGPGGGAAALDTEPGAASSLRVKALNPGIYIYHCAWGNPPKHIAHGMYGLIVVEPQEGLPEVDQEYYMMQSEFYTEAGGAQPAAALEDAGHLPYSSENAHLEEPTFATWNGRPGAIAGERALGAYDTSIEVNDTVRMFVGNAGPNLVSSFHVIGEIFDRVYVEGSFDLENENVQSTLIPAGGAVGVEMTYEVPGTYIPVDHSIFRMNKGLVGEIVVDGPQNLDVYDPQGDNSEH